MTRVSYSLSRSLRLGAVIALAALSMVASASLAQTPESEAGGMDAPHPAHIHAGTCAELGDVVIPLEDVAAPAADAMRAGAALVHEMKFSTTVVEMPFQEIVDGGHVINVHLSAEEIDVYIACGNIGGVVTEQADGDGPQLFIALGELNDSGHTGVARLGTDGETTIVNVWLVEPEEMQ